MRLILPLLLFPFFAFADQSTGMNLSNTVGFECPPGTEERTVKEGDISERFCVEVTDGKETRNGPYLRIKNGKTKLSGQYANDSKTGIWVTPGPSGKVRTAIQYQNGEPQKMVNYHPSGRPDSETPLKDGKMHGISTSWYETGEKFYETEYNKGFDVQSKMYRKDGSVFLETKWTKDRRSKSTGWYPNKKKASEFEYNKKLRIDGPYKEWLPDETLGIEGAFENGQPDGVWKLYAADGSVLKKIVYENGQSKDSEFGKDYPNLCHVCTLRAEANFKKEASPADIKAFESDYRPCMKKAFEKISADNSGKKQGPMKEDEYREYWSMVSNAADKCISDSPFSDEAKKKLRKGLLQQESKSGKCGSSN